LLIVDIVRRGRDEEFGPVQPDAFGARIPGRDQVVGEFDIGVQPDVDAVGGGSRLPRLIVVGRGGTVIVAVPRRSCQFLRPAVASITTS
jgi:hypothetical protein